MVKSSRKDRPRLSRRNSQNTLAGPGGLRVDERDADGTRAQSYATILGWDWTYIAVAHGEPIALGAKQVLRRHLNIL